jgi:cation:H+ antiporter
LSVLLAAVVALVVGLVVLVRSADVFVLAAEAVAVRRRWSPAVIGAVVVGFGTSLPELVTSGVAAYAGEADLAIGNAAGSNVANLLLVLGVAALVAPLRGSGRGPGRDVAIASLGGLLLAALALDGAIGVLDGIVLVVALGVAIGWQVRSGRVEPGVLPDIGAAGGRPGPRVVLGLAGVVLGARLLVWGATVVAVELGLPTIVIGSVLVAVGTSLPELATAIASARRGQTALLLGNLVGSNAFNALGVVGVAAVIGAFRGAGLQVEPAAEVVIWASAAVTVVVGAWLWRLPRVGRLAGALLLGLYVASVPALLALS